MEVTQDERTARTRARIEAILKSHGAKDAITTDGERTNAMAKAAALARQAGLELYEIERELNRDDRFNVKRVELGGHANWRVQLSYALRDALIVAVITHTHTVETKPNRRTGNTERVPRANYVSVVGMVSDLEIFDYLYQYISRELVKMADAAYAVERLKAKVDFNALFEDVDLGTRSGMLKLKAYLPQGKAWRDEFYRGAVAALYTRLREMFKEKLPEQTDADFEQTMALVPLKKADVDAAKNRFFTDLVPGKNMYRKQRAKGRMASADDDENAYMAGRKAGSELDLRKGIETGFTGALPAPAENAD